MVKLCNQWAVLTLLVTGAPATSRALAEQAGRQELALPSELQPSEAEIDHLEAPPADSAQAPWTDTALSSPTSIPAQVAPGRSWARAVAGYDSAAQAYRVRSSTEAAIARYLVFRVDYEHGLSTSTMDRVSFGVRLQLLHQNLHGLDLGLGLFYQPNDFRTDGNVVGALMLGRRFDRIAILASGLLGSDPEGDDQEVDGRVGVVLSVLPHLQVGLDNRYRSILSADDNSIRNREVVRSRYSR